MIVMPKLPFNRTFLFFLLLGAAFCGVLALFFLNFPLSPPAYQPQFGVTFTPGQAQSFGLDWKQTYAALLDDLGVRAVRLAAYWNVIESKKGEFAFEEIDYQLNELDKRGGKAILAIGRKLPRWPECHDPAWLQELSHEEIDQATREFVAKVVTRYRGHRAVDAWQVENEFTFPFGLCPKYGRMKSLEKEVELVRSLDASRKIIISDSGEWTLWLPLAWYGDVVGSSLYREAWNARFGRIPFPIGPGWYQLREDLVLLFGKQVIFTELQAEPWGKKAIQEMSAEETLATMPLEKLAANVEFSKKVGFSQVYMWGVEWWYWLKQAGHPEVWEAMKPLF